MLAGAIPVVYGLGIDVLAEGKKQVMAQLQNALTREVLTDFRTVVLPAVENDLSRRYLQVLMRWVPVALQAFNTWPERPHCGHFFGGVYWYGLETAGPSATLALVRVVGQADSTTLVALTIREAPDRVCVVLVQDLAQDSLRRHVLFASLPHGPCVLVEQLSAREPMLLALPA